MEQRYIHEGFCCLARIKSELPKLTNSLPLSFSIIQVLDRVKECLTYLTQGKWQTSFDKNSQNQIVMVSHSGFLRMLLATVQGISLVEAPSLVNGAVHVIDFQRTNLSENINTKTIENIRGKVVRLNEKRHLEGL